MGEPIFLGCTTPEQDARLLDSIAEVNANRAAACALRDQFAAAALTGLLAHGGLGVPPASKLDAARDAYLYANAMLTAREE